MNLIVDIGNTNVKLAVFNGDDIVSFETVDYSRVVTILKTYLAKFDIQRSILSYKT